MTVTVRVRNSCNLRLLAEAKTRKQDIARKLRQLAASLENGGRPTYLKDIYGVIVCAVSYESQ